MIGRLRGTLIARTESTVMVECGGVGYIATVSANTLVLLPKEGEEIIMLIYTQASENKIALYGFYTKEERDLFDLLITVKNVGPASAMGILSGGKGPKEITTKIAEEDVKALTKLKGVGKKKAQMLVVELSEKCEYLLATWGAKGVLMPTLRVKKHKSPLVEEVLQALIQMGFRAQEAETAVAEISPKEDESLESLLKRALRLLSR